MKPGNHGRFPALAILAGAVAMYVLPPRILERAAVPVPGVTARIQGQFTEQGDVPTSRGFAPDGARRDGEPLGGRPNARGPFWSSWNGSNEGKGELELGPFPAPRVLGLPVCGFPRVDGNELYLENMATSERIELTEGNVGGDWAYLRLWLPASWRNQPVTVHAVDASAAYYGWLAVGAPSAVPVYAAWWDSFARKLHGFLGVGMILLLLQVSAMSLLRNRDEIPRPLIPLASFALVALAGYGVFWVFSASAPAGKAVVWIIVAGCAWRGIQLSPSSPEDTTDRSDSGLPLFLMGAVGLLYFGLLTLYGSDRTLSDLAAHRFIDNLIYDNELPHIFANRLLYGGDSRHLLFGWWLSTDRPPLQTGCDLLLAYPIVALGVSFETASQAAGIWMQLLWICAAWGWLRILRFSPRGSALIIALLAPASFFLLNTVFVWPKLLSAALLLGAFSIWLTSGSHGPERPSRSAAWGMLAGLSYLAYSGAAFSLLAWAPLAALRPGARRLGAWVPGAAAFMALVLPWIAYQHFYNPPGNTLVKMHLAGVDGYDTRGIWQALGDAYRSKGTATLILNRVANVETLFAGNWHDWALFRGADLASRRNAEYYGLFAALGWWNLGFIAIGALAISARRVRPAAPEVNGLLLSSGWCVLTLVVWVLLLFRPGAAVIHQGSYACVLLLFLCLAAALRRTSPTVFWLVAIGGIVEFAQVWIPANPSRMGPLHLAPAAVAILATAALARAVAQAPRQEAGVSPTSAAPAYDGRAEP
jgi:hypothetical protein